MLEADCLYPPLMLKNDYRHEEDCIVVACIVGKRIL